MRDLSKLTVILALLSLFFPTIILAEELSRGNLVIELDNIKELYKNTGTLKDKIVLLKGKFNGFEADRACNQYRPSSRSDWVLKDGTGCIYINGPFPLWCDPIDKGTLGTKIELIGIVRVEPKNIFIELLYQVVSLSEYNKAKLKFKPSQPVELKPDTQGRLTIGDILNFPKRYENQMVTISGIFKGWKGNCKYPPPMSRSDWMIEDKTGCIYVHGQTPRGYFSAPPDAQGMDKPITVTGKILLDDKGNPYINLNQ